MTTPLQYSESISQQSGANVFLKCEHHLPTGSFKLRGALAKLTGLNKNIKEVVTASSGNHGLAVAYGCRALGLKARIYVPETASPMKVKSIKHLGASVFTVPGDGLNSELKAREFADENNLPFVSPYNDYEVIAGQGTIGLELMEQEPDLDAVITSVGGGGLISGIGTGVKAKNSKVELVGAWPSVACSLYQCLQAGAIIDTTEEETLSDGTAGGVEPGSVTFELAKKLIDHTILVSEQEIAAAMKLAAETERWMIEGAAGVAIAALLKDATRFQDKNVAVVICGRNITLEKFISTVTTTH